MIRAMRNSRDPETKKGLWSQEEDDKLVTYIKRYGIWNWTYMPKAAGLARSGKSCRLRWMNYLRPNLRHGNFAPEEEEEIIRLHRLLGNRWAAIAENFPGRTDNDIKNYWNTRLKTRACAIDGDRNEPSLIPNSGDSAISAETPASEIGSQDRSCCSHDQVVIPDDSCDISLDDLLGVSASEEEIESLWSELPPLGNQDTFLDHHFRWAPGRYEYPDQDTFSFFGPQSDHVGTSSSSYFYEDEFSVDLWGFSTNIYCS